THNLQTPGFEGLRQQHAAERIDDVTGWQITAIGATVDENFSCAGFQCLRHYLRFIPLANDPSPWTRAQESKEDRFTSREELSFSLLFAVLALDQSLRRAAIWGPQHDTLAAFYKNNSLRAPGHSEGVGRGKNGDGRPASDGNSFYGVVRIRMERERFA